MPKISQGKSKRKKSWNSFSNLHCFRKAFLPLNFCHLRWCLLRGIWEPVAKWTGKSRKSHAIHSSAFQPGCWHMDSTGVTAGSCTGISVPLDPLLYSTVVTGGPEQSSIRHSAGNSPFPHHALGGLDPSAPDLGPSCTSLNNSQTPVLPWMASFLGASCPQWSREPEENRSKKCFT